MGETIVQYQIQHEGQTVTVQVTICPTCLGPEVLRVLAAGGEGAHLGGGVTVRAARQAMPEHAATVGSTNGQAP